MGPEIVYVSGRVRPPGEMNGKSGNMNNCLGQIYPKEHRIPGNELVCVFDADQVAKKDFFLKTLPFFDAGGLHGLLLSCALPQCGLSLLPGLIPQGGAMLGTHCLTCVRPWPGCLSPTALFSDTSGSRPWLCSGTARCLLLPGAHN